MAEGALRSARAVLDDDIPDELLDGLPEVEADAEAEVIQTEIVPEAGISFPYGRPDDAPPPAAVPAAPSPPPAAPQWGTSDALAGVRQGLMSFLQSAEERLADADARLAAARKDLALAEADRAKELSSLHELMQKLGIPRGPP